jgi:hypothetical protein
VRTAAGLPTVAPAAFSQFDYGERFIYVDGTTATSTPAGTYNLALQELVEV